MRVCVLIACISSFEARCPNSLVLIPTVPVPVKILLIEQSPPYVGFCSKGQWGHSAGLRPQVVKPVVSRCVQMCHSSHKESPVRKTELHFDDSWATQNVKRKNIFSLWRWTGLTLTFIIPARSDTGCACAQQGVTLSWQAKETLVLIKVSCHLPSKNDRRCFCTQTCAPQWIAIFLKEKRWGRFYSEVILFN